MPDSPVPPAATPAQPSRRAFLKTAAVASAVVAAPLVIPARALGKDGNVPPSERIVMAGIGLNNRGRHDLAWALGENDTQFVAIADCRKSNGMKAKEMIDKKNGNTDSKFYADFRELLARPDIDAIVCATSERWHALMSVLTMRAGKDIYCEKPGSMTIAEGRALLDTQRRTGRVFQTGTQRRSEVGFMYCNELARLGRLGKIHTVYAHTLPDVNKHRWLPPEPEPPKEEFDWDMWQGPVPYRAYNRGYLAWHGDPWTHTGGIGEWGSHTIASASWAVDMDHTAAVEYEWPKNDNGDQMVCLWPNGVKLVLNAQGWPKAGVPGMWRGSCGVRIDGTEGWCACADGYTVPEVSHPSLLKEWKKLVNDYLLRSGRPVGHMRDFLNCVKSRRTTVADAAVSHFAMSTVHAANICVQLRRNLKYDGVKEEFINDPEANRLRSRPSRDPWQF